MGKMKISSADYDVTYSSEHSVVDALDLAVPVEVRAVHPFGQLEGRWWFQSTPQDVHLASYGKQFPKGFCTDSVHEMKSIDNNPSTDTSSAAPLTVPDITMPSSTHRPQSMWRRYVHNNVNRINLFFLKLKRFSK